MNEPTEAGIRLCVLGRFALHVGTRPVIDRRWPRTKAKALLKLLALQFGAAMHRERVLETLWPEVPVASAANNLHKNLHYLRVETGTGADDAIVIVREGMVTLREDVWIDAHQFVNRCMAARASQEVAALSGALELYRGELLPDDVYEPWTAQHRDNLRALFIATSLELSALLEQAGDYKAATERAAAAVQADPTTEEAHRMLMRQFARSGNAARALQQYEQCRAILRRELDIEPHERTRRMRDRIIADAARIDAIARPAPEPAPTVPGVDTEARGRVSPPPVKYATTADGARVAYWRLDGGAGVPLVGMPWLPHTDIEREWDVPEWRAWYERVAAARTLIRYDCRAVGASRPGEPDFSIDATIAEVNAVAECNALERFALFAAFHSGPAAIAYAVRHPERVSHLVLWCSYARGTDLRGRNELTSLRRMLSADWQVYSESAAQFLFAWEHQRVARQYAELIRESTDPVVARAFVEQVASYDASDLLAKLRTPTLVLHRKDMPWLSADYARQLAGSISGAQLAIVEGKTSVPFLEGTPSLLLMLNDFLNAPVGSAG